MANIPLLSEKNEPFKSLESMKRVTLLFCILICLNLSAQSPKDSPNVFIITIDGFRWQELYYGAEKQFLENKELVKDREHTEKKYWKNTIEERRASLMPFLWNYVSENGLWFGDRESGSAMNLTNEMFFSYPGYNEILTGKADDKRIDSNDKLNNPNLTILERLNKIAPYVGRVAAFGSWDVFPFILNRERAGIYVNAGFETVSAIDATANELLLNKLQAEIPSPWSSVRLDAFTHNYALEYAKKNHPKVLYIAYGETDDFAHDGDYQAYLNSAHVNDTMLKELWDFAQKDPVYKDNTLFVLTTDHGRGITSETWKHHGGEIKESSETWMIYWGAGVEKMGLQKGQFYTNQIAPTILEYLGVTIPKSEMPGKALKLTE